MAKNKEPRTRRFRLSLVDDQTHKHLQVLKFTRGGFALTILSIVLILLVGAFAVVSLTPLRTFIPGYPDAHTQRAAVQNAVTIDSLEAVVARWEFYAGNLRRVLEGEDPVRVDSIIRSYAADTVTRVQAEHLHKQDTLLRELVRETEQFGLSASADRKLPIEGIHFFTPVKGVVVAGFDAIDHPWVDLKAPAGSVVMSPLAGTVVSARWSETEGFVLVIQHGDDILSVCSRIQKVLKETGERVSAGTPVALVAGEEDLRFELWYRGEAVDPARYIGF